VDIPIDFRETFTVELEKLRLQVEILSKEIDLLNNIESQNNDEIKIGSRVLVTFEDKTSIEGRVWGKKSSTSVYEINRDGYKNYMNISRESLTNLSFGHIGELERKHWIANQKLIEYESILNDSAIPEFLIEQQFNIVEVIKFTFAYPCDKIDFVLGRNLRSGTLKLPQGHIKAVGFYEIEFDNQKLVGVKMSSEFAFESSRER